MRGFYEEYPYKGYTKGTVQVYVDGGFWACNKEGCFGCYINDQLKISGKLVGNLLSESVVCEMYAVLKGIELAIQHNHKKVDIYTDNQECMFIAGGWKCKSRYREWFERELEKLESKCDITVIKTSRKTPGIQQAHYLCEETYA